MDTNVTQLNKPTVLIVEDAPEVAQIISIAFRRTEIDFVHCENAFLALDYLKQDRPHAIILDLGLPGMDGWEFLDIIKSNTSTDDIPVIVLTSYSDGKNRKTGKLYQVEAYMQKPFDLERLRVELDNAIYIRRGQRTRA